MPLNIFWKKRYYCFYIFLRRVGRYFKAEVENEPNLPDVLGGKPPNKKQLTIEELLLDGFDIQNCIQYIHECISRRYSMTSSLRLLCLLSTTYSGIPTKEFNDLKVRFVKRVMWRENFSENFYMFMVMNICWHFSIWVAVDYWLKIKLEVIPEISLHLLPLVCFIRRIVSR